MAAVAKGETATVVIVDDDRSMRESLRRLFRLARLPVDTYESGIAFLRQHDLTRRIVLVLDVMMPGMTGIELQRTLKTRGVSVPIVFLTGSSDIPLAVQAMREGAVDFLEKPFDPDQLLARVRSTLDTVASQNAMPARHDHIVRRLALLTARERQVMSLVVAGKTSKEIARALGTSHRTVEIQRARLMEKTGAATLADLVRMGLLGAPGSL